MSDRIDLGSQPWKAIPREVLRDGRLTPRAKGGLVTLLSHQDGWIRSALGLLQRECQCGREQAKAIMRELRDLGYAEMVTERTLEGRLTTHYIVRAEPARSEPGTIGVPVAGNPAPQVQDAELSGSWSPVVRSPVIPPPVVLEPQELLEPQDQTHTLASRAEPEGFPEFYTVFPERRARLAAMKAFQAACKLTTPEVLIAGAKRYRDDPNLPTDRSKIKHPATWLRAGCWEDGPLPERNGHRPSQHPIDRRVAEIMARRNGGAG